MKSTAITGRDPVTGEGRRVVVQAGSIVAIEPCDDAGDLTLIPGLVDLQINGYAGRDFNGADVTPQAVIEAVDLLLATGVTSFAPTVITASEQAMIHSLRAISDAIDQSPRAAACIPFLHVEGPHISPLDGYRGAHPLEQVRPPSLAEFDRWQAACKGRIGLVTLSPHFEETVPYVQALVARGVLVSLGHTHASNQQIQQAVAAGAGLSTHLGNGIAAQLPRHPNPIWSQLAEDRLTASFIADGHHLPAETLSAMLRAKGPGRSFLVSDAVALAGMPAGIYTTPVGGRVELSADGRLSLYGSTALAGATVPLLHCVARAARMTGLALGEILPLATAIPGSFAGGRGALRVGARADLLRVAWNEATHQIAVHDVWLLGEHIVGAPPSLTR